METGSQATTYSIFAYGCMIPYQRGSFTMLAFSDANKLDAGYFQ